MFCMKQLDCKLSEAIDSEPNDRQLIEAKLQDIVVGINESRKHHADQLAQMKQELEKQANLLQKISSQNTSDDFIWFLITLLNGFLVFRFLSMCSRSSAFDLT